MAVIQPSDIKWEILAGAQSGMDWVRRQFGDSYDAQRDAFRMMLCDYFSRGACDYKGAAAISPVGSAPEGGKALKVRWGFLRQGRAAGCASSSSPTASSAG